jgi:hypothetical protein
MMNAKLTMATLFLTSRLIASLKKPTLGRIWTNASFSLSVAGRKSSTLR